MPSPSCLQADHSWGPTLPMHCHGEFDFTVHFEQIWLSIVPSILFLASSVPRLWQLRRAPIVIRNSRSQLVKLVIPHSPVVSIRSFLTLSGHHRSPGHSSVGPASPVVIEDITADVCFHPSCRLRIGCCVDARYSLVLRAPAIREAVHIAEHLSLLFGPV